MIRTNWLMIAELARELAGRLRGARVQDVGMIGDRVAIRLWRQKRGLVLLADLFGSPPLVWLEDDAELPIAIEPGFVRASNAALAGMTVSDVQSRRGDRILRLVFHSRSRFGVSDEASLVFELIPRFGNAILIKGNTIVAALKEFSLAENRTRSVLAGHSYEPPPVRQSSEPVGWSAASSLLDVTAREGRTRREQSSRQSDEKRRRNLERRLDQRARKLRAELERIGVKRQGAADREALRQEGDAIYAGLHALDSEQREDAKQRARDTFARYRKLGAALPHLAEHEARLRSQLEAIEQLEWELERAEIADLDAVEHAIESAVGSAQTKPSRRTRTQQRPPLVWNTRGGSRILVGRNPLENTDLTFRIARPHDLWFHARGTPGAHVILQRDDRQEPSGDDVLAAASLAALYSKGRNSAKVAVDYTQRKHVRKRPAAAPGLVFYNQFSTVTVAPQIRANAIRTPAN